jgi:hypothetical protein
MKHEGKRVKSSLLEEDFRFAKCFFKEILGPFPTAAQPAGRSACRDRLPLFPQQGTSIKERYRELAEP